jgi:hypothetical protein
MTTLIEAFWMRSVTRDWDKQIYLPEKETEENCWRIKAAATLMLTEGERREEENSHGRN